MNKVHFCQSIPLPTSMEDKSRQSQSLCGGFSVSLPTWLKISDKSILSEEFPQFFLQKHCEQCPAGRVFQYRVGSGRVLDKIPGSGLGSGRVGVSKNTIGYFWVSFLLSGISGYVGYFWVFLGLHIYILGLFSNI